MTIPASVRPAILKAFVKKLRALQCEVAVASVADQHLHALVTLPLDDLEAKRVIGKAKQAASHAVREKLPGSVWSEGAVLRRIGSDEYFNRAFNYIRHEQEPGAVVWSRDEPDDWIDLPGVKPRVIGHIGESGSSPTAQTPA